ncbi:MAG: hypothetical protein M3N17_03775 [Actinomycetota bacterium]|nr:hypothetical protein [Actinomycetota bacterium]
MAAALVSAAFAALLVAVVSDARPRLAASNSRVVASGAVLVVPPGEERCEQGQFVPAETGALRVYAGSDSGRRGEPLRFSIADADSGQVVTRREVDGGYRLGALDVPIQPPGRNLHDAEVCIENLGPSPMAFAGNRTPVDIKANQDVDGALEEVRIDLFRVGEESLWALAPTVAGRFALFKPSFAGPWTMWLVLAVAGGSAIVAVLLACREAPPPDGAGRGGGG